MPKARVYELAKELGVDSKTVLNKLEAMGEFVKSGCPGSFAYSCASCHSGCSRGIRGKACRSKAGLPP